MEWKPIIVGIDDSIASRRAAVLAQELARRAGTTCHPLHATRDLWSAVKVAAGRTTRFETSAMASLSEWNHTVVNAATREMHTAFEPYLSSDTLAHLEVAFGKPGEILMRSAVRLDASMVVIGARHHRLVDRLFGASTAEHLLHHFGTPVMIASPSSPAFQRVLVAVDFSDGAAGTIMWSERIARLFDAQLRVLHVVEILPDTEGTPVGLSQEGFFELCGETFEESIWPHVTVDGAEPSTRQGHVVETIMDEVQEWAADLLVVASHGKGIVESLLLGSTTERLMHDADVPLLIVPPKAWKGARTERTGSEASAALQ